MKRAFLFAFVTFISINAVAQIPSYVPTNGLVGYWPFNGNANDESGNGNNGVVNGAVLTTDRYGKSNSAYSFDGLDDAIIASSKNLPLGNNPRSISMWFNQNINPSPGTSYLLLNYGVLMPNQACGLAIENDGVNFVGWTNAYDLRAVISINNLVWYNLIATYDGNQSKLYLNGNLLVGSNQNKNTIQSSLSIGNNGFNQFTNGKLDDVGIWNRALTQQEIIDLYNGCQISVSAQPNNQTINVNSTANFIIGSTDTNSTYRWQTDLGVGFQNLNNVGQYSGVTNDTLIVSNVTINNNNQPFRCIVYSGSCTDTSNVAVLTVNTNLGVDKNIQGSNLKIYPNPTNDAINIEGLTLNENTPINIYDIQGKLILTKELMEEGTIDLSELNNGVYVVKIGEMVQRIVKM